MFSVRINEDPELQGSMCIQNLTSCTVYNKASIGDVFRTAEHNKKNFETLKESKGHSHTIFIVNIYTRTVHLHGEERLKTGRLYFVNVAGCENVKRDSKMAKKGKSINQSLVALVNVATALEYREKYVPYNESKLTKLLRDSFGGKSVTSVIGTISPILADSEHTLNTLTFVKATKTIRNQVEMNKITSKSTLLIQLNSELLKLQRDLAALRNKTGYFVDAHNYDRTVNEGKLKEQELAEKTEQVKKMEKEIQILNSAIMQREQEWESTMQSFELTKSKAIAFKRELLKNSARAEHLEHVAKVAQVGAEAVLKQNDELSSLTKGGMEHCGAIKKKVQVIEDKVTQNKRVCQDWCAKINDTILDLKHTIQDVREQKNEIGSLLQKLFSTVENHLDSLNRQSAKYEEEVDEHHKLLQCSLKSNVCTDTRNTLNNVIKIYDDDTKKCFELLTSQANPLEEQRTVHRNALALECIDFDKQLHNTAETIKQTTNSISTIHQCERDALDQTAEVLVNTEPAENTIEDSRHILDDIDEKILFLRKTVEEQESNKNLVMKDFQSLCSFIDHRKEELQGAPVYYSLTEDVEQCMNKTKVLFYLFFTSYTSMNILSLDEPEQAESSSTFRSWVRYHHFKRKTVISNELIKKSVFCVGKEGKVK